MVKILQVITDTNFGGAGAWLLNYLRSADNTKYDITVALPHNSILKDRVLSLDIKVVEVDGIEDKSFSVKGVLSFVRIMRSIKPDIVHTHSSLSGRIAAKYLGVKTVNTRHCLEEKKSFPKSLVYKLINNCLSDASIGVSEAVTNNLKDDGIKDKKRFLVYNGIFPLTPISAQKKAKLKESLGFSKDDVIAAMVARLEPVKNHDVFLNAAKLAVKENENLKFLIVGTGSREKELKAKVKRSALRDKTVFLGYTENINDITNIIDISVLSSKKEALALSVIEAMSLKKPVVVTDSGGTKEVVADGVSGYVVENGNAKAMAKKIVELSKSPSKRSAMGNEGAKIVEEKFSASSMAKNLDAIYNALLKK